MRALTEGAKRTGSKANHLRLSSVVVKTACNYISDHPYAFTVWYLIKHRTILPSVGIDDKVQLKIIFGYDKYFAGVYI
jgi:hypothetical protein